MNLDLFFLLFLGKGVKNSFIFSVVFQTKTAEKINLNLFFLQFTPAPL